MMEWKRTIFSGRFLCLLLCVILLNGIFFLKVQFDRSLGLDLSGPESQLSHSVVVTEEGISQSEELPQIPLISSCFQTQMIPFGDLYFFLQSAGKHTPQALNTLFLQTDIRT